MRRAFDAFGQAGADAVLAKASRKNRRTIRARLKTDTKGKFRAAREAKAAKQVPSACGGAGVGG